MCPECGSTDVVTEAIHCFGGIAAHLTTCQGCGHCDWASSFGQEYARAEEYYHEQQMLAESEED